MLLKYFRPFAGQEPIEVSSVPLEANGRPSDGLYDLLEESEDLASEFEEYVQWWFLQSAGQPQQDVVRQFTLDGYLLFWWVEGECK